MIERLLNRYNMSRRQGVYTGLMLLLSAVVYLVGLGGNKWANAYYSAAVQAGSKSWAAFFYGSFNSTGSITVDKPPLSLWFMDVSVHLFGLNTYALILPQALMGIATVLLTFIIVKRYFGFNPGLVAGFALLITPVAALMFRFNNPDALLTLLTALAIWATTHLNDSGRMRWAAIIGIMIGFAFMTKTFQGFLILPALFIAFTFFGQPKLLRRIIAILVTAVTMVISGGVWFVIVSLIPAADRPYIGSSMSNSVVELAFGYNGLSRLVGRTTSAGTEELSATTPPNVFRLLNGVPGGSIGWMLPLAIAVFVLAAILFFKSRHSNRQFFVTVLLGLSMLTMFGVFSFMRGIFHGYYTVQVAPIVAALIGVLYYLGQLSKTRRWLRLTIAGLILGSGIYDGFVPIMNNDADNAVVFPIFALAVVAALIFAIPEHLTRQYEKFVALVVIIAIGIGPGIYTLSTVITSQTGSDVRAGPLTQPKAKPGADSSATLTKTKTTDTPEETLLKNIANLSNVPQVSPLTVAALNNQANLYEYPAAVVAGQNAAAYQLALDRPVLLMGGFNGTDPSPTFAQFKKLVQEKKIHYFVLSSGGQDPSNVEYKITLWIMKNFSGKLVGYAKLYDLTQPKQGTFN